MKTRLGLIVANILMFAISFFIVSGMAVAQHSGGGHSRMGVHTHKRADHVGAVVTDQNITTYASSTFASPTVLLEHSTGNIYASGSLNISGGVVATGSVTIGGDVFVAGGVYASGPMEVDGYASFTYYIASNETVISAGHDLTVDNGTFDNDVLISGTLGVTGDITSTGTLKFGHAGTSSITGAGVAEFASVTVNSNLDMTGGKIVDVGTPVDGGDATNKTYVDTAVAAGGGTLQAVMDNGNITTRGYFSTNTTYGIWASGSIWSWSSITGNNFVADPTNAIAVNISATSTYVGIDVDHGLGVASAVDVAQAGSGYGIYVESTALSSSAGIDSNYNGDSAAISATVQNGGGEGTVIALTNSDVDSTSDAALIRNFGLGNSLYINNIPGGTDFIDAQSGLLPAHRFKVAGDGDIFTSGDIWATGTSDVGTSVSDIAIVGSDASSLTALGGSVYDTTNYNNFEYISVNTGGGTKVINGFNSDTSPSTIKFHKYRSGASANGADIAAMTFNLSDTNDTDQEFGRITVEAEDEANGDGKMTLYTTAGHSSSAAMEFDGDEGEINILKTIDSTHDIRTSAGFLATGSVTANSFIADPTTAIALNISATSTYAVVDIEHGVGTGMAVDISHVGTGKALSVFHNNSSYGGEGISNYYAGTDDAFWSLIPNAKGEGIAGRFTNSDTDSTNITVLLENVGFGDTLDMLNTTPAANYIDLHDTLTHFLYVQGDGDILTKGDIWATGALTVNNIVADPTTAIAVNVSATDTYDTVEIDHGNGSGDALDVEYLGSGSAARITVSNGGGEGTALSLFNTDSDSNTNTMLITNSSIGDSISIATLSDAGDILTANNLGSHRATLQGDGDLLIAGDYWASKSLYIGDDASIANTVNIGDGNTIGAGSDDTVVIGTDNTITANSLNTFVMGQGNTTIVAGSSLAVMGFQNYSSKNSGGIWGTWLELDDVNTFLIGRGAGSGGNRCKSSGTYKWEFCGQSTSPEFSIDEGGNVNASGSVYIGVDSTLNGDVLYEGVGSGIAYGEVWALDNATATTISVQNTWYQFTEFGTATAVSNLTTPSTASDSVTVTNDGVYFVSISASFSGGNSTAYELQVFCNNGATSHKNIHTERMLGAGGDVGSVSMSGILSLSASDEIELWIRNIDNTNNATIRDATLTVYQIGGN